MAVNNPPTLNLPDACLSADGAVRVSAGCKIS